MSRTTTIRDGGRYFWCFDDAFGVWAAYLAQALDARPVTSFEVSEFAETLHVASAVTDFGVDFTGLSPATRRVVRQAGADARDQAVRSGDVSHAVLAAWIAVDDLRVAGGVARSAVGVEAERILEVADMAMALLDGRLPRDPAGGRWFVGHTGTTRVMEERRENGSPNGS